MKLIIVYGTRPEFLKLKPLLTILKPQIPMTVIRVNQHENLTEDTGYYDHCLYFENLCDERINNIGANILAKLPKYLESGTHILAQGDTATCFYSLLTGFQMKKQCIHLESGMRTYDLENPYPEEGFRQMISRITDIHLCPSQIEKEYLVNERVHGSIYVVGNTILDLVMSYQIPVTITETVLITLHRRENWDHYRDYINAIYQFAKKYQQIKFYFLTHPNPTLKQIILEVSEEYSVTNIDIMNSIPHDELIQLLSSCRFVITDSGGIQEESNFLGKHIYMLRKVTERKAIPSDKITSIDNRTLLLIDPTTILPHNFGYEYGNGHAAETIAKILLL